MVLSAFRFVTSGSIIVDTTRINQVVIEHGLEAGFELGIDRIVSILCSGQVYYSIVVFCGLICFECFLII